MFSFIKSIKYLVDSIYKIYRMIYWWMKFISLLFQIIFYWLIITWFVLLYKSWILNELYLFIKNFI